MIDEQMITKTIQHLKNSKASGPSGIGPKHLKYIAQSKPIFAKKLAIIFNALLNTPALIARVPHLFEFRAVFIPKKNNDWRPIAI